MEEMTKCPQVGGRGINPGSWVRRADAEEIVEKIPPEWEWPEEAFTLMQLKEYVAEALALGISPKSDIGELDQHSLERGRWYRLPWSPDISHIFVHDYTKEIVSVAPCNFKEDLSPKDVQRLGVFVKDLPDKLRIVYHRGKCIPFVYGSNALCDIIRNFAVYGQDFQFLDTSGLKKVNAGALEDCRRNLVSAIKHGKTLCIYLGDHICEFRDRVCVPKNRDTFPVGVFSYGGLNDDFTLEKIFRDEDKPVKIDDKFSLFLMAQYDGMDFEMSKSRQHELLSKIPDFERMEIVRSYCQEDREQLIQTLQSRSTN